MAEVFHPAEQSKRTAFTLAEVLITLGIIGVVAALTLPTLIQNHRNHVVETRLKKVYSVMNQAIALAEIDYGERENWHNLNDVDIDKNGNPVKGSTKREKWLNKYLVPYMKVVKVDINKIYFQDGSILTCTHGNGISLNDWAYSAGENCKAGNGSCVFNFNYMPECDDFQNCKYIGRGFEPYKYTWNGSQANLIDNCKNHQWRLFCAALIQYNGWKIPKDYPFKVTY